LFLNFIAVSKIGQGKTTLANKPSGNAPGNRIGLKKPGGSISDLQTPTKGNRRFGSTMTSIKPDEGKKNMKLVSLAQRRTNHKRNNATEASHTFDELNFPSAHKTHRSTLGNTADLRALREAKNAKKEYMLEEDEQREEMLFGDIEINSRPRFTQESYNTHSVNYRNTVN
jgi:hypothetical protein